MAAPAGSTSASLLDNAEPLREIAVDTETKTRDWIAALAQLRQRQETVA
ncbi:hypothetical protein ACIPW5_36975 [Streptomyces sp. NPDC090077]